MGNPAYRLPYSNFFKFDDRHIKCIDEDSIEGGKVRWSDFYPHDAFLDLLKLVVNVVDNKRHTSIRVEGAYGTGKSYAVLTIKKLIEASVEEVEQYFNQYGIDDSDLLDDLKSLKEKKVLIVFKEGSSGINSDTELINTIQNSINKALKSQGYSVINSSVQDSIVNWLNDPDGAIFFDKKLDLDDNRIEYGISSAKSVVEELSAGSEVNNNLIKSVVDFADKYGISISKLTDIDDLKKWMMDVINSNGLYSIFFIWDEFTEFLSNNQERLTGLQNLLQMDGPFNMMVVTHQGEALFSGVIKKHYEKLNQRFTKREITLPDNMALKLIGSALRNKNPQYLEEWNEIHGALKNKVHDCVYHMAKKTNRHIQLIETDLESILPISPYAGLILKYISTTLQANQRSMFEFIKDDSDEFHGFKWFIEHHCFMDKENILTVDMLWDFFYNNMDGLDEDVHSILSAYDFAKDQFTSSPESERVFKAILLMRAMSDKNSNSIDILKPTVRNLKLAFTGVKLGISDVESIANALVNKYKLLMLANDLSGEPEYSLCVSTNAASEIEENVKKQLESFSIDDVISENSTKLDEIFKFSNMYGRFEILPVSIADFKVEFEKLKHKFDNKIYVLICLAIDEVEQNKYFEMIQKVDYDDCKNIVVVDYTSAYFKRQNVEKYVRARAWAAFYQNKDLQAAQTQIQHSEHIVTEWCKDLKLFGPTMYVYDDKTPCSNIPALKANLLKYSKRLYPLSLENLGIDRDDYFTKSSAIKMSVGCGINQDNAKTKFSTSKNIIENALSGIWKVNDYWLNPELDDNVIVQIKKEILKKAENCLESDKRIPLEVIINMLANKPFGFVYCDFSAYMIGFLLKEYAVDSYVITNSNTPETNPKAALKEAIVETMGEHGPRYRAWYIQPQTNNVSNFYKASSEIFGFVKILNIDSTVNFIRNSMGALKYPFWALSHINLTYPNVDDILRLIELFTQIVKDQSQEKMNLAEEIGSLCNDELISILKKITTKEECKNGMLSYINEYASKNNATDVIDITKDNYDVLIELQSRTSSSGDSSWVWDSESWDSCLDRIIDELRINAVLSKYDPNITLKNRNTAIKNLLSSAKMPIEVLTHIHGEYADLIKSLDLYSSSDMEIESIEKLKDQLSDLDGLIDVLNDKTTLYTSYFPSLSDFEDVIIEEIIVDVPSSKVTLHMGTSEFKDIVFKTINSVRCNLELKKLKQYWFTHTGSRTTQEWSINNLTPIACVVNSSALHPLVMTLDRSSSENSLVSESMKLLEHTDILDKLNDSEYVDARFRTIVLNKYSSVFTNLDSIRKCLHERLPNIDTWVGSTKIIEEFAKKEYAENGKAVVLDLIDSMPPIELKEFLKDKIQSNMTLGMELLSRKE